MKRKISILAVSKTFFILLVMCCLFSCQNQETENKENYVSSIRVITLEGDTATIYGLLYNGWQDKRTISIKYHK